MSCADAITPEILDLIAKFTKSILMNKHIQINGDGNQSRDFIFVEDLCDIIIKIIFLKNKKLKNLYSINIATGKTTSINKIINILSKIIKNEKNLKIKTQRKKMIKGEIKISKPSNLILNKTIGKYHYTSIDKGLRKTFAWWKNLYYSQK